MPFDWRLVGVSEAALKDAASIGLQGDLEAKLKDMLKNSVPFSHPKGNRRFGAAMLLVRDNVLQSVAPIQDDPLRRAIQRKNKAKAQAKKLARNLT